LYKKVVPSQVREYLEANIVTKDKSEKWGR
jgi:hypothetical protein